MKVLFFHLVVVFLLGGDGEDPLYKQLRRLARGDSSSNSVWLSLRAQGKKILPKLLKALPSDDEDLASGAALLLSLSSSPRAEAALFEYLQKGNTLLHPGAIKAAAVRVGQRARPLILPYLRARDPKVRRAVLEVLVRFGTLEDFPIVASLLEDHNTPVRREALICLGYLWERTHKKIPRELFTLFSSLSPPQKEFLYQNSRFLPSEVQKSLAQFSRAKGNKPLSLSKRAPLPPLIRGARGVSSPSPLKEKTPLGLGWAILFLTLLTVSSILVYAFFQGTVVSLPLPLEDLVKKSERGEAETEGSSQKCSQKNCTRRHFKEGFCSLHYVDHHQNLREQGSDRGDR